MKYDLNMIGGDIELTHNDESTRNGILLNLMTRLGEIKTPTYNDYGSRIHETIKAPYNNLTLYKIRGYTEQALISMDRISKVNDVTVTMKNEMQYQLSFDVTTKSGNRIKGDYDIQK